MILSTAYLPPVEYISAIYHSEKAEIEQYERYQKQSYRSRCHIYGASGLLPLTIPVSRLNGHYLPIREMKIDYSGKWQQEHWRAIVSAYRTSPFFEYYEDDFAPFYKTVKYENLFDFNLELINLICQLTGINCKLELFMPKKTTGSTCSKIIICSIIQFNYQQSTIMILTWLVGFYIM